MIIDSHCHLNYEPMSLSLKETIQRANNDGVKYLLTISTEDKSFGKILSVINNNKCVYGSYGIHPHEAQHLVLIFFGFFFSFAELLVIQGEPRELPHPKIVNLFFNLVFQIS